MRTSRCDIVSVSQSATARATCDEVMYDSSGDPTRDTRMAMQTYATVAVNASGREREPQRVRGTRVSSSDELNPQPRGVSTLTQPTRDWTLMTIGVAQP